MIANNSSGMACGIVENTYRTLESLVLVLPSGTMIDTGAPDADDRLRLTEPELYAGLLRLRDRVRGIAASVEMIRRQYAMKNTMGYGVNAFLDHDTPSEILAHLIVGSEGTLGFVAEATFRTVPVKPRSPPPSLSSVRSRTPTGAPGAGGHRRRDARADGCHLLRVGQGFADAPEQIRGLDVGQQAALLVEYQATSQAELRDLATAVPASWPRCPWSPRLS